MKVEIVKLDGSFGPLTIEMTAETDADRATLSVMGKVPFSSTNFRIYQLSGNASDGSISKLTLEEYEEDPKE